MSSRAVKTRDLAHRTIAAQTLAVMVTMLARFLLCAAAASRLGGQSLDIGGIDVRLGQSLGTALSQVQAVYSVVHLPETADWLVTEKSSNNPVGSLTARDGLVVSVGSYYPIANDGEDVVETYTLAMRAAQRRGGKQCTTSPIEYSSGRFPEIRTFCGQYKLSLFLPQKRKSESDSKHSTATIWLSVGRI